MVSQRRIMGENRHRPVIAGQVEGAGMAQQVGFHLL